MRTRIGLSLLAATVFACTGPGIDNGPSVDGGSDGSVGDLATCGGLGQSCCAGSRCGIGFTCVGGTCVDDGHPPDMTTTCSGAGTINCAGACVDPATDDQNCGACGNACPVGTGCSNGACVPVNVTRWVIDKITYPATGTQYAIDLNGDGHVDNQFGRIVSAIESQNLDLQGAEDTSVASGHGLELVEVATGAGTTGAVKMLPARDMPNPDFSGNGTFTQDLTFMASVFMASLSGASVTTPDPVTTKNPVALPLRLSLTVAGMPLLFLLDGAHVQFTLTSNSLMNGQIDGSIKESDVQTTLIPAWATMLNQQVQASPSSSQAKQILQLFDIGDGNGGCCINPDGSKGCPSDGVIAACEVAGNSLIQSILAPDVQIFDAQGNYAPNPANTHKDSLSLGVAFTAVPAKF